MKLLLGFLFQISFPVLVRSALAELLFSLCYRSSYAHTLTSTFIECVCILSIWRRGKKKSRKKRKTSGKSSCRAAEGCSVAMRLNCPRLAPTPLYAPGYIYIYIFSIKGGKSNKCFTSKAIHKKKKWNKRWGYCAAVVFFLFLELEKEDVQYKGSFPSKAVLTLIYIQ